MAGCGFLVTFLALLSGQSSIGLLIALAVGALIPYAWVSFKAKRRMNAFEDQLPDLLVTHGRVAQGRPQLQAGHPDDRRGGPRAGQQGARPRHQRHTARAPDGRRARRDGRADRLEELLVRDHRRNDPAPGRRQPRRAVRHGRRHRAPAAAVRPQDQGSDRDGPRVGLRADRPAVLHRDRDHGDEPELHGPAVPQPDGPQADLHRPDHDGVRHHCSCRRLVQFKG